MWADNTGKLACFVQGSFQVEGGGGRGGGGDSSIKMPGLKKINKSYYRRLHISSTIVFFQSLVVR